MKTTTYLMTLFAGAALALTPIATQAADDDAMAGDKKGSGFIGKITEVSADSKTVTVENKKDDKTTAFTMAEEFVVIDENGKEVEVGVLAVGKKVRVITEKEGDTEAKKIKILGAKEGKEAKEKKAAE